MEDDENGPPSQGPASLLPYDVWTEEASRQIAARALAYVGAHGMPGEHHFYISFLTDRPGVIVPQRLLAQYPREMTIVLQHQFWELTVDEPAGWFSVGLSFGGIPTVLSVPFAALTAFADPHVNFGLRFNPQGDTAANDEPESPPEPAPEPEPESPKSDTPQVVSLDAFRKRPPAKEP